MRELKPSLAMMLATCRAAVAGLMDSSPAMALLLRPSAISVATCRSRRVSVVGRGPAASYAPAVVSGGSPVLPAASPRASATAASALTASPCAHERAIAGSPRRRAGARYFSTRAPGSAGRPAASRSALAAAVSRTACSGCFSRTARAANASRPRATPIREPVEQLSRMLSVRCWRASSTLSRSMAIRPRPARQRAISGRASISRRMARASR